MRFEEKSKIEGQTGLDPSADRSGKVHARSAFPCSLQPVATLQNLKCRPVGILWRTRSKNRQCPLFCQPITKPAAQTGLKKRTVPTVSPTGHGTFLATGRKFPVRIDPTGRRSLADRSGKTWAFLPRFRARFGFVCATLT